jgi:hypothetical protein
MNKNMIKSKPIFILITLLIMIAIPFAWTKIMKSSDVFEELKQCGYTLNTGLSNKFMPGNILQTIERLSDGREQPLSTPIVVLWASDCFPDVSPQASTFVLPKSSKRTTGQIKIDSKLVSKLLPWLALDSSSASDYSLKLNNLHIVSYAKGDLSHHFSKTSLHVFENFLASGDKMEYYTVILEAVVADALNIEIHWQQGLSAGFRARKTESIKKELSAMVSSSKKTNEQIDIGITLENDEKITITTNGPITLGYLSRPLYAVTDKNI